jgi:hypothetical protein
VRERASPVGAGRRAAGALLGGGSGGRQSQRATEREKELGVDTIFI